LFVNIDYFKDESIGNPQFVIQSNSQDNDFQAPMGFGEFCSESEKHVMCLIVISFKDQSAENSQDNDFQAPVGFGDCSHIAKSDMYVNIYQVPLKITRWEIRKL